jgi:hypothetical protein
MANFDWLGVLTVRRSLSLLTSDSVRYGVVVSLAAGQFQRYWCQLGPGLLDSRARASRLRLLSLRMPSPEDGHAEHEL